MKNVISTVTKTTPDALTPPCDTDYNELEASKCSDGSVVPADPIKVGHISIWHHFLYHILLAPLVHLFEFVY